jgi:hypothetical protein
MKIKRLLLLACMALVAIAYAAPAGAQANVQLKEKGVALKAGAEVTATSTNLETTFGAGDGLVCELVTLHLKVVKNGTNTVVLEPLVGGITTKGCKTTGGLFVTIENPSFANLTLNTWGTGVTSVTFAAHLFLDAAHTMTAATCHFSGNVHVQAAAVGGSGVNVGPSTLTSASGGNCPKEGVIHGGFTLETKDGTAVTTDFVKTA